MGERSTKSIAITTSSMKGKNRKQIELKVTLPLGPLIVLRHAIARKEMQCVTTNFWGLALEHSLTQERPRLIFWFFFFIRLADQLIIALNSVSCALKGFFFAHLLLNPLNILLLSVIGLLPQNLLHFRNLIIFHSIKTPVSRILFGLSFSWFVFRILFHSKVTLMSCAFLALS